ncbi:MAG: hypothetical protein RR346_06070 [Bacteroidales bacterium]
MTKTKAKQTLFRSSINDRVELHVMQIGSHVKITRYSFGQHVLKEIGAFLKHVDRCDDYYIERGELILCNVDINYIDDVMTDIFTALNEAGYNSIHLIQD